MDEITKELLEALKGSIENAEQEAFERWLADESPSGDTEQVKRQWEESSDLRNFLSNWKVELVVAAKAEAFLAAPQPSADGWIPWEGGACPVEVGTRVDAKFRDGEKAYNVPAGDCAEDPDSRSALDWYHMESDYDIIAYRVVKP